MGSNDKDEFVLPHHTKVDPSNRIAIPKHLSDRLPWMKEGTTRGWLLLIGEGRYRLLSDEQVKRDPELEPVCQLFTEGKIPEAKSATSAADAAIIARLMPITISPPGPTWRISIPKSLDVFVPESCNKQKFSIMFSFDGSCEIWYTDILKRAALATG